MEPESPSTSGLSWIWFLECLATNKQVDYLTLRYVARKLPGLSGSAGMLARELLALRCLEGLAEMGHEPKDAPSNGPKIDLDLSQRCSITLFRITSEAVDSSSGLDELDVSKWDIQSFVKHKRAKLPKSTLEQLEEMIIEGKDPASVSLREITGIRIIDHPEDLDRFDRVAKGASLTCDGMSYHQVAAGNSIPQNNNEKGSCQDICKGASVQNASTEGGCHLKKDGDVHSHLKKSTEDNHVCNNRPLVVSNNGDRVPDQHGVTSSLKKDGSDIGKKPQDNDIEIEQFSEQRGRDDQDVHTLKNNMKLSSDTSQVLAAQTVLGKEFRKEIKSPVTRDSPITAKCNQQQAVLPVVNEIKILNSDRNQNVDGGHVGESVVKPSRHDLQSGIESYEVRDITSGVATYQNEEVDVASCKNTSLNARGTTFDGTALALCIKCIKSGHLLCCNSNVCSVAVHGDCLGAAPCFDCSGNFICPLCASSLATAEYLKAKSKVDIREKELHVYLGSNLSKKAPQRVLNNKKKRHLKQDDPSYPVKRRISEEKAETHRINSDQNVEQGHYISGDVNPTHKSPAICLDSDMPNREINNKAMRHVDLGITDEPPILRAKDILPHTGRNTTTNSTTCQPRRASAQPPLPSEGFEQKNSGAIVLYKGNEGYDMLDTTSQNPPESKMKHGKAVPDFTNRMTSETTPHVPYQGYPAHRKRKVPWTAEEEEKLKEGVRRLYDPQAGPYIPWTQILEFGALVFHPRRTAENLKDKWRNICKKEAVYN
ncbi:unnamed protein product [Rhodiola kirilowii]